MALSRPLTAGTLTCLHHQPSERTGPFEYVAYYRVSTKQQGESGLGLEAQRKRVLSYVLNPALIVGEFTDIESGKLNQRVQLSNAIHYAQAHGARQVIAKLDRLSRNLTIDGVKGALRLRGHA